MRHRAGRRASQVNQVLRDNVGYLMLVLAFASALQLAWFSYTGRSAAEKIRSVSNCQTNYNFSVSAAIEARSQFSDTDRASLVSFIRTISVAKTRDQSRQALNDYLAIQDRLEKQRAQHPIPKLPPGRCQ